MGSHTVKAAVFGGMPQQLPVGLQGRLEDENPAVEAVRPAGVGGRRQLPPLKQLVHIAQHLAGPEAGTCSQALLARSSQVTDAGEAGGRARRRWVTGQKKPAPDLCQCLFFSESCPGLCA